MNEEQIIDQTKINIKNHHFELTINQLNKNTRPLFQRCSEILLKNNNGKKQEINKNLLQWTKQKKEKNKPHKKELTVIERISNTPIYKEAIEYILQELPEPSTYFSKGIFEDILKEFYTYKIKSDYKIKESSIKTYTHGYLKYMMERGYLEEKNNEFHQVEKKMPHNTMLFLNWVEHNNIKKFTIQEFINEYPYIKQEHAEKIMAHQIQNGVIWQNDNYTFTVNENQIDHFSEIGDN
jgi:hypothetical protein